MRWTLLCEEPPDCIVLDLMLPDHDGWEITEPIQDNPHTAKTPIIMLTAREDKILRLDLGADDYLTKPFNPHVLLARIRVRVCRSQQHQSPQESQVGELHMDVGGRTVTVAWEGIDLTPTEFALMRTLMLHQGYVFSRDEMLEKRWATLLKGRVYTQQPYQKPAPSASKRQTGRSQDWTILADR
jgi:DNA-binding response OmpR family regulator